jgi:hypothetical protein
MEDSVFKQTKNCSNGNDLGFSNLASGGPGILIYKDGGLLPGGYFNTLFIPLRDKNRSWNLCKVQERND